VIIDWIKSALALVGAFFTGKLHEKYTDAKDERDRANENAQKWADSGLEPTPDRLRRIARSKTKLLARISGKGR